MGGKKIKRFYTYSFNGGWKASFSFDSVTFKEKRKSKRRKGHHHHHHHAITESRMAIDVLRRKRITPKVSGAARNWFQTIAGLISPQAVEIKLPSTDKLLILHFNSKTPTISGVFDFPMAGEDELSKMHDWPFLPMALKIEILSTHRKKWPEFISKASIKNLKTRREYSVTISTLLKNYFGLIDPKQGDGLVLNPDGLTLIGAKNVPWEENEKLPGKFRYRFENDTHLLEIEKNPEWISSLRNYQYRVINATAHQEDDDGLPEINSPGIGLVSSLIPDKVYWHLINRQWQFIPSSTMFEGEVRGAAGATSRLRFDEVLILNNGKEIRCKSGKPTENSGAYLDYQFNSEEKSIWTGEFDAELESDSRELMKTLMQQYGLEESDDRAWVQTESGVLQVPLQKHPSTEEIASSDDSLFKGLIRLSEVPWVKNSDELPPSPDVSQISYSSLLILNAESFEASFTLDPDNDFSCKVIEARIDEPVLRLEDFLPIYLPPPNDKDIFNAGPPDLPEPTEFGETNPWNHFLGLSLIRNTHYQPNEKDTNFKIKISYQPGIADKNAPVEGDWTDSHTEIAIPAERTKDIQYWYRPPGLHWLPGLPLYGDPRKGNKLNSKRTYLPLNAAESSNILLKPGVNWQIPMLMSGEFVAPKALSDKSQYAVFSWVMPELPGIALELKEASIITILNGMPVAGKLNWVWRHDLPILDEINTLRVSNTEDNENIEKEDLTEQLNEDWTDQLATLYALSQAKGSLLFKSSINLKNGKIVQEDKKKVNIENLFARQVLPGVANLQIVPPKASLSLTSGEDTIDLITDDNLLKGANALFDLHYDPERNKFHITPDSTNGTLKIEAGTMIPTSYDIDNESITIDQQGIGAFKIKDDRKGRVVMIPSGDDQQLRKSWLWSHNLIDLSTLISHVKFNFSNVPLVLENNRWVYKDDIDLLKSEQLRNFRWASIGNIDFWGLPFQVCNLKELQFEEGENASPSLPNKAVFDGILHLKPFSVQLADSSTQRIQVTYIRNGVTWELKDFTGAILWPFFEVPPDLSNTANIPDPMPWLSSLVSMEKTEDTMALVFGNENQPATVSFRFMERTWKLPVSYTADKISNILSDNHTFSFRLVPSEGTVYSKLVPTKGDFYLKRKGVPKSSKLVFNLVVAHESGTERALLDITFDYSIGDNKDKFSLKKADVLSLSSSNHLISLSGNEKGTVELSPGKLSMAINKAVGWGKNKPAFELLPGWDISDKESLQAYLSLEIINPPANGEVIDAPLKNLEMVIETAVSTPDVLSAQLIYSLNTNQVAQLEIKLTGILSLSNEISWSVSDETSYIHEIDIVLREAILVGSKLDATGEAFFRPKYMNPAENNGATTGMIEIPCLVKHRLTKQNGASLDIFLQWTAPQSIRIANTKSYIEEVLLRGTANVQLAAISSNKTQSGSHYRSRFRINTRFDYSHDDLSIKFKPSAEVEMGFVGDLGAELEQLLNITEDIMVIDATEAFWIRPLSADVNKRSPMDLWRKNELALSGMPTFDIDFDDSGKSDSANWTRLAMPFITDTTGHIRANKSQALNKLLSNIPPSYDNKDERNFYRPTYISRESILNLSEIDQFSLDNQPAEVKKGNGFDQVIYDPAAYQRLFPFTTTQSNFDPGWLSFNEWQLDNKEENTRGIPFGSTLSIIKVLNDQHDVVQLAVTEAVPKIVGLPGDNDFQLHSYFIASPVVDVIEKSIPFRSKVQPLDKPAGTSPSEQEVFEEIRIAVQFWLPENKGSLTQSTQLILATESVFLLGITEEDSWETVLFAPEDTTGRSKVRKRIWDWVEVEKNRININVSPLLRVRLLTPSTLLEDKQYFLIQSRASGGLIQKSRRKELNTNFPLTIDPRFEQLPEGTYTDSLAAGPELLSGQVYYEPRAWFEPTAPVLDNQQWKGIVTDFKIEPPLINKGDTIILSWRCDKEGTVTLTDREGIISAPMEGNSFTIKPEQTTVYVLTLYADSGEVIDMVEASVLVRIPAAGNAVGFTHKIAGTAPGPLNQSRKIPNQAEGNYRQWLEMTRDLVFEDVTRNNGTTSLLEPGILLPASRKIAYEALEIDKSNLSPFLAPRVGHIFTSGRPGAMMRYRLANLIEGEDATVRRGGSWANEFRFPRPVPLPPELYPFDPEYQAGIDETDLPSCSVEVLEGPEPFAFYGLAWQDPIFNRRLHAVAQELTQGELFLSIDRIVYSGKDICYPEIKILNDKLTNWKVKVEVKIQRTVNFLPETVEKINFEITKTKVINVDFPDINIKKEARQGDSNRFVFEVGINQPEAIDDNFIAIPENEDLLVVTASLLINNDERDRIQLKGLIRTDKDSWSQPQNAYGVIRKVHQNEQEIQSDIVAFGWAPKPKIVKRRDRFRADSWEGTFRHKDAFVKPPNTSIGYEVMSITSYGEMKMNT